MIKMITAEVVTECGAHQFQTEASTLQWPPGYFPLTVETDLGNKLALYKVFQSEEYARYRQTSGCVELVVYND